MFGRTIPTSAIVVRPNMEVVVDVIGTVAGTVIPTSHFIFKMFLFTLRFSFNVDDFF